MSQLTVLGLNKALFHNTYPSEERRKEGRRVRVGQGGMKGRTEERKEEGREEKGKKIPTLEDRNKIASD